MKTMRIRRRVIALAFLLLHTPSATGVNGQTTPASALERGSFEQRYRALLEILTIPPARRDGATWAALFRETTRVSGLDRQGALASEAQLAANPGFAPFERSVSYAYFEDLREAVAQSRDPAVIPILAEFHGLGGSPSATMVSFGDLAVPTLLEDARGTDNHNSRRSGARLALAWMLQRKTADPIAPVSDASRKEITRLAKELWSRKFELSEVGTLALLAAATGDVDLRALLERLATDSPAWAQYGTVDRAQVEQLQAQVRVQLIKFPKPVR